MIEKAGHLKKKTEIHWNVLKPIGWGRGPRYSKGIQGDGVLHFGWICPTRRHTIWPLLTGCTGLLHLMTSTNKALVLLSEIFTNTEPKCSGRSRGWSKAYHFTGVGLLSGWEWVFAMIMVGNWLPGGISGWQLGILWQCRHVSEWKEKGE